PGEVGGQRVTGGVLDARRAALHPGGEVQGRGGQVAGRVQGRGVGGGAVRDRGGDQVAGRVAQLERRRGDGRWVHCLAELDGQVGGDVDVDRAHQGRHGEGRRGGGVRAADRRVHVGLDLGGGQGVIVDADLVDQPGE